MWQTHTCELVWSFLKLIFMYHFPAQRRIFWVAVSWRIWCTLLPCFYCRDYPQLISNRTGRKTISWSVLNNGVVLTYTYSICILMNLSCCLIFIILWQPEIKNVGSIIYANRRSLYMWIWWPLTLVSQELFKFHKYFSSLQSEFERYNNVVVLNIRKLNGHLYLLYRLVLLIRADDPEALCRVGMKFGCWVLKGKALPRILGLKVVSSRRLVSHCSV